MKSLAVKWRPKHLEDVVGQDNAKAVLATVFKTGRHSSAYGLWGESGCGKTTLARIIGRTLNCKTGVGCGKCDSCKLFDSGADHPDFHEVNAADTRGIDDMRALIKKARYVPTYKVRIILIDEVHMLTVQSANCLLKSLEEPAEGTLWLLATTNPEKLLRPLVNRCISLPLRPVPTEQLARRLHYIAKKEGYEISKKMALRLADYNGGMVRNALSMLENILGVVANDPKADLDKAMMEAYFSNDDVELVRAAAGLLLSVYSEKPGKAIKYLGMVKDHVGLAKKLSFMNGYVMYSIAKAADPSINNPYFGTPENRMLWTALSKDLKGNDKETKRIFRKALHVSKQLQLIHNDIFNTSGGGFDATGLFIARLLAD